MLLSKIIIKKTKHVQIALCLTNDIDSYMETKQASLIIDHLVGVFHRQQDMFSVSEHGTSMTTLI